MIVASALLFSRGQPTSCAKVAQTRQRVRTTAVKVFIATPDVSYKEQNVQPFAPFLSFCRISTTVRAKVRLFQRHVDRDGRMVGERLVRGLIHLQEGPAKMRREFVVPTRFLGIRGVSLNKEPIEFELSHQPPVRLGQPKRVTKSFAGALVASLRVPPRLSALRTSSPRKSNVWPSSK